MSTPLLSPGSAAPAVPGCTGAVPAAAPGSAGSLGSTYTSTPGATAPPRPAQAPRWACLPAVLRERPQWLLAGPSNTGALKVPMGLDYRGRAYRADSTEPGTWLGFDVACAAADLRGWGIGYVLHESDPFSCVDFDVKNASNAPGQPDKWTSEDDRRRMHMLAEDLDSYTERSQSRQGAHVWVLGNIGAGIKTNGVELYSRERFIVCTGDVVHDVPIAYRQAELDVIAERMRAAQAFAERMPDEPEAQTDDAVMRQFWYAKNAARFHALWAGDWVEMGYPSQSEADQALMTQLAFYTRNDEQVRRLFRMSTLGQRDKATKDDRYLDLNLRHARGLLAPRLRAIEAAKALMDAVIDVALAAKSAG